MIDRQEHKVSVEKQYTKIMDKSQQIKEFLLRDQQQDLIKSMEAKGRNDDSKDDIDDGALGGDKRSQ